MDPVAQPVQPIGIEENRPQAQFLRAQLRGLQAFWSKALHRLNLVLPKDGSEAMTGPLELKTYTRATMPDAGFLKGSLIHVSDGGSPWSRSLVSKSADQSIPDSVFTPLIWQAEAYDNGGWFANSGDSIFTVPAGVTRARLTGNVQWDSASGTVRSAFFRKNAGVLLGAGLNSVVPTTALSDAENLSSPVVDCVASDTFQIDVFQESGGGALNALSLGHTYFAIEAVEFAEGYGGTLQFSNGTRWVPAG